MGSALVVFFLLLIVIIGIFVLYSLYDSKTVPVTAENAPTSTASATSTKGSSCPYFSCTNPYERTRTKDEVGTDYGGGDLVSFPTSDADVCFYTASFMPQATGALYYPKSAPGGTGYCYVKDQTKDKFYPQPLDGIIASWFNN